jgi:hypothetical protein
MPLPLNTSPRAHKGFGVSHYFLRLLLAPRTHSRLFLRRRVLDKFCIGDVALGPGEELAVVEFEHDSEEGERFFLTLRQRVEKYFRENKVRHRSPRRLPVWLASLNISTRLPYLFSLPPDTA